jgi:transcriptional regulator with XRE-family HTH domain
MADQGRDAATRGARIRRARLAARKTRPELAEAIGVTTDTIKRWEQGRHVPRDAHAIAIARVTRTDPSWILYGEEIAS